MKPATPVLKTCMLVNELQGSDGELFGKALTLYHTIPTFNDLELFFYSLSQICMLNDQTC